MQEITCERTECGTHTFLIDHQFTLDKGWSRGSELSGGEFYVCPHHAPVYVLTPLPSAVISPPAPEGDSDATGHAVPGDPAGADDPR